MHYVCIRYTLCMYVGKHALCMHYVCVYALGMYVGLYALCMRVCIRYVHMQYVCRGKMKKRQHIKT